MPSSHGHRTPCKTPHQGQREHPFTVCAHVRACFHMCSIVSSLEEMSQGLFDVDGFTSLTTHLHSLSYLSKKVGITCGLHVDYMWTACGLHVDRYISILHTCRLRSLNCSLKTKPHCNTYLLEMRRETL